MSLTSQLDDPSSPLSRFLELAFPELDRFCAEALAQLPATTHATPDRGAFVPWATIGTATDHRLRLAFTPDALPGASCPDQRWCSPVTTGLVIAAERQAHHLAQARRPGHEADAEAQAATLQWERITAFGRGTACRIRQTAARIAPHRTASLALPGPDEAELCRLCYAAAWFDELAHRPEDEHEILNYVGKGGFRSLEEVLAVVPRSAVGDMVSLVRLAARSELAVRRARAGHDLVTAGPLFSGGADVGGADGDLIIAGTLIDIKTTIRPSRQIPAAIRQLLGYLLIDYADQHAIAAIGIYLARQGELITWNVSDLLAGLGAMAPLETLRHRCRETLQRRRDHSPG